MMPTHASITVIRNIDLLTSLIAKSFPPRGGSYSTPGLTSCGYMLTPGLN